MDTMTIEPGQRWRSNNSGTVYEVTAVHAVWVYAKAANDKHGLPVHIQRRRFGVEGPDGMMLAAR